MDYKDLAKSALTFFIPVLKSKAVQKMSADFSEAINNEILILWNKVKPLLIEEIADETNSFEESPEDKELQADIYAELKKMIKKDELLQNEIVALSQKVAQENPAFSKQNILNFTGDFNIGVIDSNNVVINSNKPEK
jgi:hypothetical protein